MSEGINSSSFQDLENLDGNQVHILEASLSVDSGHLKVKGGTLGPRGWT